ncbi:MAG: TRAP transporter TatT component family protein [Pseudomonadota bacterium]
MALSRRLNIPAAHFILPAFFFFLCAAEGCSFKHLAVRGTAEVLEDGVAAFEAEPDVTLAHEAAASQMKLLEALHRADPANREVILSLAKTFGSYTFAFLERAAETDPVMRARAAALYHRGAAYGLDLLELRLGKGTAESARTGTFEAWGARLARARIGDVPALFWTAYAWGNEIRKSAQSPASVAALPRVVAMMERVLELQPAYHFGAAHLFMGVYYSERPRLVGGDPKKAQAHFTKGVDVSEGRFVMAKYLWARFGAVQTQDSKLFNSLLKDVIDSPAELLPQQRLSQEIARGWAQLLKTEKSKYFAED